MDTAYGNTSAVPVQSAQTPVPAQVGWRVWIEKIITWFVEGMLIGVIAAAASIWIPSNRIVVFSQPYSEYIRITSVRIARPGFIVLYESRDGALFFQQAYYLKRGYYRNLIIPIETLAWEKAPAPLPFVARLYVDNGNGTFSQEEDRPVKNIFGRVQNANFWLAYAINRVRNYYVPLLANPFGYIADVLFP